MCVCVCVCVCVCTHCAYLIKSFPGVGGSFTYIGAVLPNTRNFPSKHRAKVVGLYDCMAGLSPLLFALVYYNVLARGHLNDPEEQDAAGLMLLFAAGHTLAGVLCVLFLREYPVENDGDVGKRPIVYELQFIDDCVDAEGESKTEGNHAHTNICTIAKSSETTPLCFTDSDTDVSQIGSSEFNCKRCRHTYLDFCEIVKNNLLSVNFQLVLWTYACNLGLVAVLYNNIAVILQSNDLNEHVPVVNILLPAFRIPFSLGIGNLSDIFLNYGVPRSCLFLLAGVLNFFSHLLCLFLSYSWPAMLVVSIFTSAAMGVTWSLAPTQVTEMFSADVRGRMWGICLMAQASAITCMQALFGLVVDLNSIAGTHECRGKHCFTTTFIVTTFVSLVPIATNFALIWREIKGRL